MIPPDTPVKLSDPECSGSFSWVRLVVTIGSRGVLTTSDCQMPEDLTVRESIADENAADRATLKLLS